MSDAEVVGRLPGKLERVGAFRNHRRALETATVVVIIRRGLLFLIVVVVLGSAAVAGFLGANRVMGGICCNGLQTEPGENTER